MNVLTASSPPVPAYQAPGEFAALWQHVAGRRHAVVVEIGSLFGGTLWGWLNLPGAETVVSVDVVTDHRPIRDEVLAARAQWRTWPNAAQRLCVFEGDSHSGDMRLNVEQVLGSRPIDFLFVDGDHSYDGVLADFKMFSPLVRPGGVVAFHDTVPTAWAHEPGVVRLVNELKWNHRLRSVEWFAPDQDGVGITAFEMPA